MKLVCRSIFRVTDFNDKKLNYVHGEFPPPKIKKKILVNTLDEYIFWLLKNKRADLNGDNVRSNYLM